MTECKPKPIEFHTVGSREVVGHFDGGDITSDAGGLMLREVEQRTGILKKFGACFTDHRKSGAIEHPVEDLVAQRSYGLCLGYEDLNDHDALRADPILAVMVGKKDPKGEHRREERDRGKALAGKSTLNRLELTRADVGPGEKYKKIVMHPEAIDRLMVDHFMEAQPEAPLQIILDLDATDDAIHGHQEGRFFHGYYDCYCYLPLYIFCGEFLLSAQLRSASIDPAKGAFSDLKRVVAQIRAKWPRVHILVPSRSTATIAMIRSRCEGRSDGASLFGITREQNPQAVAQRPSSQRHRPWSALSHKRNSGKKYRVSKETKKIEPIISTICELDFLFPYIKQGRPGHTGSLGRWTSRLRSPFLAFRSKALQPNQISRFQPHSIRCPLDVKRRFKLDVVRWTSKGIFTLF